MDPVAIHQLRAALTAIDRLERSVAATPLDRIRWTPPQQHFLEMQAKRRLFRAGNQIGKSWAGLADTIWRCLGRHPYQVVRRGPIEAWIACYTWPQSVAAMGKLRRLLPADEVHPYRWRDEDGLGKEHPTIVFRNGSIIRFKTLKEDAGALSSATIHHVQIDEACTSDRYRELERRVMRTGGTIALTFTPINARLDWLKEAVEAGRIAEVPDILRRLTVANLTPAGAFRPLCLEDGTPMDQDWIDEQWRTVLPAFAGIVLDGDWNTYARGVAFPAFDPGLHVIGVDKIREDLDFRLFLGVDFGERDHKQQGILTGLLQPDTMSPLVTCLGQVDSRALTTTMQDADAILNMLVAWGWGWPDLHAITGDVPFSGGAGKKQISDLTREILRARRRRGEDVPVGQPLHPRIRQAKRGKHGNRGSVERGVHWLHQRMLIPGAFRVVRDPRADQTGRGCARLIEALGTWAWEDDEWKDSIDGLRYSVWPVAMGALPPDSDE